jgi:thymidylate synthase (FAD)
MDVLSGRSLCIFKPSCTVELLDVMPRLVKRTIEDAIIISARTSTGNGLKTEQEDKRLLLYLLRNNHTSPLESVKFSFRIKCPIFTARQLIRHRTANINEFSQRYAQVEGRYKPLDNPRGIRVQSTINKQGSVDEENNPQVIQKIEEVENLLDQIDQKYKELLQLNVAREIARFCLPLSTWTVLVFTMDLNNFLKFLRLRLDHHAQEEIRDVASSMWDLTKDLMPTVREFFE